MAENKSEKDPKIVEIEVLKKNFEKWRKISLQGIPIGMLAIIFSLLIRMPFFWRFILFVLGCTPFVAFYISHSLKIVRAWENGVVFRRAKTYREVDPGWRFLFWPFDSIQFVDMRETNYDPPDLEIFTLETVDEKEKPMPAMVDIVFGGQVIDPKNSILKAENVKAWVVKFVLGELRSVCSKKSFEDINRDKDTIAIELEEIVNKKIWNWGYKILKLQIQSIKQSPELLKAQEQIQVANKRRETVMMDVETEIMRVKKLYPALNELSKDNMWRFVEAVERMAKDGKITIVGGFENFVETLFKSMGK